MNKKTVREWGEDTAHSYKGHYRTADLKSSRMIRLIYINVLFAIFSIIDLGGWLDWHEKIPLLFGLISLIASVQILIHQSQEGNDTIQQHMQTGDKYLNIHKHLQNLYNQEIVKPEDFQKVAKQYEKINLDATKPIIHPTAKRRASRAIEKKGEVNLWWIEEQEDKNTNHATHNTKNKTDQS